MEPCSISSKLQPFTHAFELSAFSVSLTAPASVPAPFSTFTHSLQNSQSVIIMP